MDDSVSLFGPKARVVSELKSVARQCSEEGWDGCRAVPVSLLAVQNAEDFIRALPENFPLPEIAAEPDGAISLDWIRSRDRLVSLSIGEGDGLAYAWLSGLERGHAVAHFDGQNVSAHLLSTIRLTLEDANAALRAS